MCRNKIPIEIKRRGNGLIVTTELLRSHEEKTKWDTVNKVLK